MHQKQIQLFEEYLYQRRYSVNTIKVYRESLKTFARFFGNRPLETVTNEDLEQFNYQFILKRGLSSSYQNQVINALKLYYQRFHNTRFNLDKIERPRDAHTLPTVLNLNEVEQILNKTKNIKHRTMLSVIYSCGLRSGELLNMRINDICLLYTSDAADE